MEKKRCSWADPKEELYLKYHDEEWGRPCHEDNALFELLILEGFQAGLSWITILKKRAAFREAFDGFDPVKVAAYGEATIEALMQNKDIIRNRRKIEAAVTNARVFLDIQRSFGSFDAYLWGFTDGKSVRGAGQRLPVSSPLSDRVSADLKKRGMKFVGTVIICSYLHAVGVVHDHEKDCFLFTDK